MGVRRVLLHICVRPERPEGSDVPALYKYDANCDVSIAESNRADSVRIGRYSYGTPYVELVERACITVLEGRIDKLVPRVMVIESKRRPSMLCARVSCGFDA